MADIVQRVREAIVAALDTKPAIVAVTNRTSDNVVPFRALGDHAFPVVAYFIHPWRRIGGIGDVRELDVQFTCVAATDAVANALVDAVLSTFTAATLAVLPTPLKAHVVATAGEPVGFDRDEDSARADLTLTLQVTA